MKRVVAVAVMLCGAKATVARGAGPSTGPTTSPAAKVAAAGSAEAVRQSLAKATAFLLAAEKGGNWEGSPSFAYYKAQKTGWTALALDALLSAGVSPREPGVEAAVKFLKANPTDGVYALGLRMQVWQRLAPAADVRRLAEADLGKLLADVGTKGDAAGMYSYFGPTKTAYSHSRSQYAAQGVAAAGAMGLDVPPAFWTTTEAAWVDHQAADGGWSYTKANRNAYPETNGMTTVAVASLLLARDALHEGESADCRGVVPDPAIAKGLKWLGDHAATLGTDEGASDNQHARAYPYPTLYGAERAGAAGGAKYFGSVNWYQKGAAWLLAGQNADGGWGTTYRGVDGSPADFQDTCFAVLFLARGRVPVFMQKLDYSAATPGGKAQEWDQRPRDVANLAKRTGVSLEQELAWQTVTLASPERDFHDAPVLYVGGKDAVAFDAAARAKLKAFVEGGGLIVANADCGGLGFANGIRKLGTEVTPYEFRTLPAGHPIFTRQQFPASRWKRKPAVLGLSNGVRELMVLLPAGDPGRAWDAGAVGGHEADFELGSDLFQYVASRTDLRSRGESYVVDPDPAVTATATIKVGRLKYASNWDPEPGGWRAMAAAMHNGAGVDLDVRAVAVADDWAGLAVVALTGTEKSTFPAATAAKVKGFVDAGGTLLVDAAGGAAAFATGVDPQVEQWVGGKLETIPPGDPLFAAGGKLGPVKYRPFAVDARGKLDVPRLRGVKVNGRWAAIVSDDDLSAGMVGEQVDGVLGYDPATATDLVRHVLLAAKGK